MDNVRRGLRIRMYCGNKEVLPPNTERGTPFTCFRRGIAVGQYVQARKDDVLRRQRTRTERRRTEAITGVLMRRQIARDIEEKGVNVLKREIKIGQLPLGLLRAIAQKLTGTANAINRYGSMTLEELKERLIMIGFQE